MIERRTRLTTTLAAVLILGTTAAVAQEQRSVPPPPDNVVVVRNGGPIAPLGGSIEIIGGEGSVIGKVVTDKPYSARSITESTQTLADGNRIVNRNEAHIYRDSAGRTRLEQTVNALGVWQARSEPLTMVTINDPVAKVSYFLNPAQRTARQLRPFDRALGPVAAKKAALDGLNTAKRLAIDEAAPAPPIDDGTGPRVFLRALRGDPNAAPPGAVAEKAVAAAIAEAGTVADKMPVPFAPGVPPGGLGFAAALAAGPGTFEVEDIGEQVLQGVTARGTRETRTIPAGAIGNERPIEIVMESWYSPDLDTVVLRRNIDPRFGETTYELVDVERSEPSPDLFAVPQDYKLLGNEPQIALDAAGRAGDENAANARAGRRVFLVQPGPAPRD